MPHAYLQFLVILIAAVTHRFDTARTLLLVDFDCNGMESALSEHVILSTTNLNSQPKNYFMIFFYASKFWPKSMHCKSLLWQPFFKFSAKLHFNQTENRMSPSEQGG